MPNSSHIQLSRQQAIRELLSSEVISTQSELVQRLLDLGFDATQSCVSRDLRDLGIVKSRKGYQLEEITADASSEMASVSDLIRDIKQAGPNLLVIKTAVGAAQRVALALDRSEWSEIIGNIGGDDTVFVATTDASSQRRLLTKIERATH